jgi:hypothetical protein
VTGPVVPANTTICPRGATRLETLTKIARRVRPLRSSR